MKPKIKAHEIYAAALDLHGEEHAKQEAIKSITAIQALAPFEQKSFWQLVMNFIQDK
jgi:hypothetical protein